MHFLYSDDFRKSINQGGGTLTGVDVVITHLLFYRKNSLAEGDACLTPPLVCTADISIGCPLKVTEDRNIILQFE